MIPEGHRVISAFTTPRHLVKQAAESLLSLPVRTDKEALRRPVNAIFRQKDGQFLLPLRARVPHRPAGSLTARLGSTPPGWVPSHPQAAVATKAMVWEVPMGQP